MAACRFCGRPCAKDVIPAQGCKRPSCLAKRTIRPPDVAGIFPSLPEMVRRGRRAQEDVDEILRKHDADVQATQDECIGRAVQRGDMRAALDALAGPPLGSPQPRLGAPMSRGGPLCRCGWAIPLIQFRLLANEDIAIHYELRFACPCCGFAYVQGKSELADLTKQPGGKPPKGLPPGR